jgi:hypothetical protein
MLLRTSMTTTNNIGESGSPCPRPRTWQILLPGLLFIRTLVVAVDRRIVIHSVHLARKTNEGDELDEELPRDRVVVHEIYSNLIH